jgi:hypothetical protein
MAEDPKAFCCWGKRLFLISRHVKPQEKTVGEMILFDEKPTFP